jgi:ABC-type uncharacterized transport system involved in gliding motility auxiliary subunit
MAALRNVRKTGGGIGLLILVVLCVNIIAARVHGRIDVTAEKVYTLSDGTKDIIKDLKNDVEIKFYFSRSIKELPVQIKTYASRVEEVLGEYAARSGGRITVSFIDPKPDTDDEEWARKYGVQGVALPTASEMFFGVVFLQGTLENAIPYLDPRREEFLEYDLSEALLHSQKSEKHKVGILSSLPIMNSSGMGDGQEQGEWAFVTELRKSFEVSEVATTVENISKDLSVLIVYHPKNLSDSTLYAIDQFVVQGGRLIVAVDPMSRVDLMHQARAQQNPSGPPETSSDLKKLFDAWGIVYDSQQLVGDIEHSVMINAGGQELNYPFFINFTTEGLSKSSVTTGNLTSFMFAEGGFLDVKPESGSTLEPLITSSKTAGTVTPMAGSFTNPVALIPNLKVGSKPMVLAGVVNGKFKSAFPEGKPMGKDSAAPDASTPQVGAHVKEADKENSIVVIADSDFIFDNNAVDKMRFMNQVMLRPKNGNLAFLINTVDFLGGSKELISIRSKGRVSRPFTVVEDLQRRAQEHWKKVEDDLSNQLSSVQKKLNDLQAQRADGSNLQMTSQQQAAIGTFREEERQVRMKRREVRKNLREDIESLGNKLAAANLLFVPTFVSGFGIAAIYRRSRRGQRRNINET